jgi:hypothetical protein
MYSLAKTHLQNTSSCLSAMGSDCWIIGVEASSIETVQTWWMQNCPCFVLGEDRQENSPFRKPERERKKLSWLGGVREKEGTPVDGKDEGEEGDPGKEISEEVHANKERPI